MVDGESSKSVGFSVCRGGGEMKDGGGAKETRGSAYGKWLGCKLVVNFLMEIYGPRRRNLTFTKCVNI